MTYLTQCLHRFDLETPLQNRQLDLFMSKRRQYVDDFVGELLL